MLPAGERLGYAQNFVTVSRACTGDLLFFADQDDVWHADKLEIVERAAPAGEAAALFHDFSLQDADGSLLSPSFFGVLAERGFGPTVALKGCTIAVTRAFIDTWDWPRPMSRVSHDFWVALLATAFGQRRILTDVLIDHRTPRGQHLGLDPRTPSRARSPARATGPPTSRCSSTWSSRRRRLRARTETLLEVVAGAGRDGRPGRRAATAPHPADQPPALPGAACDLSSSRRGRGAARDGSSRTLDQARTPGLTGW